MNTHWEEKKLGEVCKIIGGGTPAKANKEFYNGDIRWATVRDMKYDIIEETEHRITKKAVKNSSTNIIPKGNVVIATRVGLGKICLLEDDTAINQDLKGIIPKHPKTLSIGFLFRWFKSIAYLIEEEGTGATVQGVKLPFIKSLEIPLPPLPEQKRIVAILDEAFAAITKAKENAEKNLKNARELFESYLQNVFSNPGDCWKEKTLGECFSLKSGDNLTRKMMNSEGEYSVFGGNGIAGSHDKYNLTGSNIIVGRVGALCGNVRHINKKIWLTDNAFRITDFKYEFDHAFLTYLLNFKNLRNYARQAAQPVISNSSLEGVLLQFPTSTEMQRSIVLKLNALSEKTIKLEAIYQQKLASLEELKKSILQKAFSGELKGATL